MFFDSSILLLLPAIIFSMWAQFKVQSNFDRYSKVRVANGMTGAQAAAAVLRAAGISNVRIEKVAGHLSDHFDPRDNVIRLSESVHDKATVAAIGVAAHEAGHAIQYAHGYSPMKVRAAIIPMTNVGSKLALPLLLIGFLMAATGLIYAGIALFSTVALFQLVTLPVEFNASNRALAAIQSGSILTPQEIDGSRKVLTAAALTYVAALAMSVMQILRFLMMARSND
jgi:Zn-dependent membrane protease YugP